MYSGAKLFSTSTPSLLFGKSLRCPTDAITTKSLPINFLRVLTLVGDSTIRRDLLLGLRVDLALAFDFIFGFSLAFCLTIVLATKSPNIITNNYDVMPYNRTSVSNSINFTDTYCRL